MSKYFSYDAIDVNLYVHDTAKEAKQSALDIAEDGYNLSSDQCDGLSKGSQDLIKSICYGVILGGIDLPVRQPSVEQDGADAVAEFKYMVQPPVIVEYEQNNGWIKREDRLPNEYEYVLAWIESRYKPEYKSVTITHFYDGEFEIQAVCHFNVLYWQPLPPPPTE